VLWQGRETGQRHTTYTHTRTRVDESPAPAHATDYAGHSLQRQRPEPDFVMIDHGRLGTALNRAGGHCHSVTTLRSETRGLVMKNWSSSITDLYRNNTVIYPLVRLQLPQLPLPPRTVVGLPDCAIRYLPYGVWGKVAFVLPNITVLFSISNPFQLISDPQEPYIRCK
jgi:hypothetical protein